VGGGGGGEVGSAAFHQAGAGYAEATVAKGEGHLCSDWSIYPRQAQDGKGTIQCVALCSLHGRFDMRPLAAPGQMGHSSL
jgi:hypothetical protein